MAIQWRDSLTTGVQSIDSQHREIFARFEGFVAACNAGNCREEVVRILDFLSSYVVEHFDAEELLQRQSGYAGYREHREHHQSFLGDLTLLQRKVGDVELDRQLVMELRRTMIRWLILHIRQKDRDFAEYYRQAAGVA
jgi:hemerythrin